MNIEFIQLLTAHFNDNWLFSLNLTPHLENQFHWIKPKNIKKILHYPLIYHKLTDDIFPINPNPTNNIQFANSDSKYQYLGIYQIF